MRIITRLKAAAAVTAAIALMFTAAPAMAIGAPVQWVRPYTCIGGDIPSGTYSNLTVAGACSVPAHATVNVTGNVIVLSGAQLDASSAPSTITVGRDVTAVPGAMLDLGCTSSHGGCGAGAEGPGPYAGQQSAILVKGSVTIIGAYAPLNGLEVRGDVTVIGGPTTMPPWAIKDNTIGRNLTVTGLTAEWFGILRNDVGGNVVLTRITMTGGNDAPGSSGLNPINVVSNTIDRNLVCTALVPGVSVGFSGVDENHVGGQSLGQCAGIGVN